MASRAASCASSARLTSTTWTRATRTTRPASRSSTPTQRTLYSFKPDNATDPVPDLAADKPQISDDLKTITVKIKPGVKFSPPVNRAVTSKDVKYAFERFFSANVGGQYTSYFSSIVGAPKAPDQGREADLRHRDAGRPDARHQAQRAAGRQRVAPRS